jgi:hypothetical protein
MVKNLLVISLQLYHAHHHVFVHTKGDPIDDGKYESCLIKWNVTVVGDGSNIL